MLILAERQRKEKKEKRRSKARKKRKKNLSLGVVDLKFICTPTISKNNQK